MQVILVCAMNVPFAVRRQVTKHQGVFTSGNLLVARTEYHRRQRRFVYRQGLAVLHKDFMIQIEMLATCQGSERHQPLDIRRER
ncbi:hypothetical protein D3C76_1718790 [compost metagenome]